VVEMLVAEGEDECVGLQRSALNDLHIINSRGHIGYFDERKLETFSKSGHDKSNITMDQDLCKQLCETDRFSSRSWLNVSKILRLRLTAMGRMVN
jgi:hypothetical protein